MKKLLSSLRRDFPGIKFKQSASFYWSPEQNQVTYRHIDDNEMAAWSLLHEVSHAACQHKTYQTDLELLMMEVEAWQKAKELADKYSYEVDEDHIQDCLDTYRDWLNQRCTCPICGNAGVQSSVRQYKCFNCATIWQVSSSRFCRPYRQLNRGQNKTPQDKSPAVFR